MRVLTPSMGWGGVSGKQTHEKGPREEERGILSDNEGDVGKGNLGREKEGHGKGISKSTAAGLHVQDKR